MQAAVKNMRKNLVVSKESAILQCQTRIKTIPVRRINILRTKIIKMCLQIKAKYKKVLELPTDLKRQIAQEFGVSVRMVNRAFDIEHPLMTEKANRIRVRGYDLGAILNKKLIMPNE